MHQDARYDRRLLDTANDLELAAAARAAFDLDPDHALEPARPIKSIAFNQKWSGWTGKKLVDSLPDRIR
jgi:hypothetical protein